MATSKKTKTKRGGGTHGNRRTRPSENTVREIWARAGGMCAHPNCGDVLYHDKELLSPTRLGEIAHNVGASADGPRGDVVRSPMLADDPENLILLCPTHHTKVDQSGAKNYPEELLRAWKTQHERNVQMAGSLITEKSAKPIIVRGPIGHQKVAIEPRSVVRAMMDNLSPPTERPVTLDLPDYIHEQASQAYWEAHANKIRGELALHNDGKSRLAIFAIADQPSLIYLGTLLGDKAPLDLYQFTRDTNGWSFVAPSAAPADFTFNKLSPFKGDVALKIGLTAPIADERVLPVLGLGVPTVNFTTSAPGTGLVQTASTIAAFRKAIRQCLEMIEQAGGTGATIHVFPVMPAPLAVALGASVMPKVSNPLVIYDARGPEAMFKRALTLPFKVQ